MIAAGIFWLHIITYPQPSEFPVDKSALTIILTFKEAPGPSATQGTCSICGGQRFAWVAERQVRCLHSAPLFNNMFPPFVLLIIDQFGGAVPLEP